MAKNNALNRQSLDDFTVTSDTSGGTTLSTVEHTSDTANSSSQHVVSVAGSSAGDPQRILSVDGNTQFKEFIDNDDSDKLKLDLIGTGTFRQFFTTGERLLPLQPAFAVVFSGSRTNVTGDGTVVIVANYTSEFDSGGNFDLVTGLFTVPQDGRYYFSYGVLVDNIIGTHTSFQGTLGLNGTGLNSGFATGAGNTRNGGNQIHLETTDFLELSATDTIDFRFLVSGSTKTVGYTFASIEGFLAT